MILRQFLHNDPVIGTSYLLGCGGQATGAVVDPIAPPDYYIRAAADVGLRIRAVIDTHIHADHYSTGPALASLAGAEYLVHASAEASLSFRGVQDGEHIELGNVLLEVLHVPGHTPEHIALLGTDRTRGPEPWFVLTGHTLMVGDMGRTELASSPEDGARALFRSAKRLRQLPDYIEVLPGAYAGSVCGRGLSGKPTSTIGFELRFNRAFRHEREDEFVRLMLQDIPPRPENAEAIRAANLGGHVLASTSG